MDQLVAIMATGSGRPDADKPSRDRPALVHVPWSTPGARVTLGSDELYNLNTECVPDVLGMRARRPEAAVIKVVSAGDSQCVRVLIPDENVWYQGFHDVLLFDMADEDAPYVAVNDVSAVRKQWPVSVVSGMTRRQLEHATRARSDIVEPRRGYGHYVGM